MINTDRHSDGIIVVNDQIFSVQDLLRAMHRLGINIRLTRDGLIVDGERISSISKLDDTSCPLAKTCEKRIALVEFLKLQQDRSRVQTKETTPSRDIFSHNSPLLFQENKNDYPYKQQDTKDSLYQTSQREHGIRRDSNSDFIKPNNHDLFEGNVSEPDRSFPLEEEEEEDNPLKGLFDEPDIYSNVGDNSNNDFEQRLFYDEQPIGGQTFDDEESFLDNRDHYSDQEETDKPFCSECGFDLEPNWNSCPNCGYKVIRSKRQSERLFL
jgi:predicted RNA-binding Zn-ribbon protein involved in translation (DUF1610 family)